MKTEFPRYSYEQMMEASTQVSDGEYDWTICYSLTSTSIIDKKAYISSLLNKYGPVGSLELTPLTNHAEALLASLEKKETDPTEEKPEKKEAEEAPQITIHEYIAKVTFVSPKHAWLFFNRSELRQEREVEVEGAAFKQLFAEGSLVLLKSSRTVSP